MTKILFILTSHSKLGSTGKKTGYHLAETTHAHHILSNAGYMIDFASIKGGEAPIAPDCLDLENEHNKAFLADAILSAKIKKTLKLDEINHLDYQAIYLPGGYGAMWDFIDNPQLQQIIANVYENSGVIGAVCHGPAALVNVILNNREVLVKDKAISCFTDDEEAENNASDFLPFSLQQKLIECGAKHTKAANFQSHMQSDQRLVTGQNPASAEPVAKEIARLLNEIKIENHFHYHDDDDDSVTSPRPCCG